MCIYIFTYILIENVQNYGRQIAEKLLVRLKTNKQTKENYGFKAVTLQIVSYLVEIGYRVTYQFRIIKQFRNFYH
jgi:hypothetical protein